MEPKARCCASTVVLAALGGAAVGAAIGILLAPRAGIETRQQITCHVNYVLQAISNVPEALKSASHAAREAMGNNGPVSVKRHAAKA